MISDLRFSLRLLAKSPTFTVIAVLTLAIGIGSATVIFSAVNALFLKPLPLIKDGDRVLSFSETGTRWGETAIGINYADFRDLKARLTTLDGLWVFGDRTVIIAGASEPERVLGTEISPEAFGALGVKPILGRNFLPHEDQPGAPAVALISYELWQRKFAGSPELVGTTLNLNGVATQVVGIMPKGWGYPNVSELWTPFGPDHEKLDTRGNYFLNGHAKLKPGATLQQLQAEADTVMASLAREYKVSNEGIGVRFVPLRDVATHDSGQLTKLLFGAVLFVYLIACLNVANLLLARGVTRSKEIAVRLALGAKRSQLVRHFLIESVVLGLLGGVGGVVLALWGVDLMKSAIPIETPFWMRFEVDRLVLCFSIVLSILAAFLFGTIPAVKSTRPCLINQLKEGGRSTEDLGAHTNRLRNILVVAEVAIALVLLVGATLLLRSFINLRNVNPGFVRENVLTFRAGFPPPMFGKDDSIPTRFFQSVEERISHLPGVVSAGLTSIYFGNHNYELMALAIEGRPEPSTYAEAQVTARQIASPALFRTLQIPLVAGRLINESDKAGAPEVAVVDVAFARALFGGPEAAIGHRVRMIGKPGEMKPWVQIVGVVGNVIIKPDAKEQNFMVYRPQAQEKSNFMSVVIQTRDAPMSYVSAVRNEVLAVNGSIPIYNVSTLDETMLREVWTHRFFSYLFAIAGCIALFLACIGIYGVMTYNVSQRQQELGMRMALGASPDEVIQMVLRRGLSLVTIGLVFGLLGALLVVPLLSGTLYGISPRDPPTFALVPVLLVAVALLACYLPSRRITRIDPNAALRYE